MRILIVLSLILIWPSASGAQTLPTRPYLELQANDLRVKVTPAPISGAVARARDQLCDGVVSDDEYADVAARTTPGTVARPAGSPALTQRRAPALAANAPAPRVLAQSTSSASPAPCP